MTSFIPINQLPAPLAAQYPPLYPVPTIPHSAVEPGANPPSNLSSASVLVAPNTGLTRTAFGGKSVKRHRKHKTSSRKSRRKRHTRSRRYKH